MVGILANQKGGVAKTVNTVHLGSALAQKGYRVLLIDSDPQCDLSHSLGVTDTDTDYTITDFLDDKGDINFFQKANNLFLLAGNSNYISNKYKVNSLKKALNKKLGNGTTINDMFDFIFIDCPPSKINIDNNNYQYSEVEIALYSADFFLIPLKADDFSVKNANIFLGKVSSFIEKNKLNLKFLGFFFGCILSTENSKEYYTNIFKKSGTDLLFDAYVRQDVEVKKAIQKGLTIFQHKPNSRSANDYIELTNEFLKKIKQNENKK
ncbi:ParA family protein [Tenacibaculum finnmarkense]|uniref:ParA family protein n=1 Tax=Tenacibaculum finnmarkense TaxID=2781243 RepID=UPI001EFB6810|nr:ParA family protein [Tenacibaculum finnmarkense]MCG8226362.1 ParA family protein [Tenacibaculum finnmarkense genomovar finnmarkense]